MGLRCPALLAISGLLATAVAGHHSFAAEYDASKPIVLKGVVIRVEWMNPHAHFFVDVKDESGKITSWDLETGSPNALVRAGWNRDSLKVGDEVTVFAFRAKDGSTLANARTVRLADGRSVFTGASGDIAPSPQPEK